MSAPVAMPGAPHILVVEDSATQAMRLALLLEEAGYRTTIARSGEQALALLPGDVQLVLSDVVMPGMDGYALCRHITGAPWGARLPVVLLTSLNDPLAIVRGLESGASHFVSKPYEPARLLGRVQRTLATPDEATRTEEPVVVRAGDRTFTIAASRARVIDLLLSSYDDVAHLYEAEQRATRSRDDMLAIVSHDLRNPLSTIGLSAQLLLDLQETGAPLPLAQQLGVIRRSVDRANALINDLLDVSRIESATLAVDPAPVDAAALLRELADEFAPIARDRGVTLRQAWTGDDGASALADRQRIAQVLSNLVGNALKFTPRGGEVTIAGCGREAWVELSVRDSGVGIPAANLPYLFDRFWQAREHRRAGAGLGLFIARGIIEAHGGTISVASTEGEGTTFAFTVPRAM